MKIDYSYLKNDYPEVITLDQLYRICHISKRKGKWLLENKIIPCEDTGKKTRRFKIKLDNVISYLTNVATGEYIPAIPTGIFSSNSGAKKKQNDYDRLIQKLNIPECYQEIYKYYEKKYQKFPDALDVKTVSEMLGFGENCIHRWIKDGKLKIYCRMEHIIPKTYVIEFCCTQYYIKICNQLKQHKEDILGLHEVLKKYSEGGEVCPNIN